MKGTVQRPRWPAPAAKTATHPEPAQQGQARGLTIDRAEPQEPPINPENRITLAILEESTAARTRGYDPYNKTVPVRRPVDAWHHKRKRD